MVSGVGQNPFFASQAQFGALKKAGQTTGATNPTAIQQQRPAQFGGQVGGAQDEYSRAGLASLSGTGLQALQRTPQLQQVQPAQGLQGLQGAQNRFGGDSLAKFQGEIASKAINPNLKHPPMPPEGMGQKLNISA